MSRAIIVLLLTSLSFVAFSTEPYYSLMNIENLSCDKTNQNCVALARFESNYSYQSIILISNNFGKSWQEPAVHDFKSNGYLHCDDEAKHCIMGTKNPHSNLIISDNGGLNWSTVSLPHPHLLDYNFDSQIIAGNCAVDSSNCFALLHFESQDFDNRQNNLVAYISEDDGKSWQESHTIKMPDSQCRQEDNGYVFNCYGVAGVREQCKGMDCIIYINFAEDRDKFQTLIYKTNDFGVNWTTVKTSLTPSQNDILPYSWDSTFSKSFGLALKSSQEIFTSENGGISWSPIAKLPLPENATELSITTLDCNNDLGHCLAAATYKTPQGSFPQIYVSIDNGLTWNTANSLPIPKDLINNPDSDPIEIRNIHCNSIGSSCIALGSYPVHEKNDISYLFGYFSNDGGYTWKLSTINYFDFDNL